MINVRNVLRDRRLTQKVVRIVSTEEINQYGEAVQTQTRSMVRAVVTSPDNGEMVRYVDSTTYKKAICVTSEMVFYPDNLSGQPDIIVWHDENYVVVGVEDYRDFGYTRAICALTDLQSAASHGNFMKGSR